MRVGPPAVEAASPTDVLMEKAGFVRVSITDVTPGFLDTARAWLREFERHEADVKVILGAETWAERQTSRASIVAGIEDGLLSRSIVSGIRGPQGG